MSLNHNAPLCVQTMWQSVGSPAMAKSASNPRAIVAALLAHQAAEASVKPAFAEIFLPHDVGQRSEHRRH
jgi:hypothetical protein